MQVPKQLIASLGNVDGFDQQAFENVHDIPEQVTSIRLNPFKTNLDHDVKTIHRQVPWTKYGFYLSERPSFTFDPLFHAGCYYVQEASSMFLEQALKQTVDLSKSIKVLEDKCRFSS